MSKYKSTNGENGIVSAKIYDFLYHKRRLEEQKKNKETLKLIKKAIKRARTANVILNRDLESIRIDLLHKKTTCLESRRREEGALFVYISVYEDIKACLIKQGFDNVFAEKFKRKYINMRKEKKNSFAGKNI